jgi:DNA primase
MTSQWVDFKTLRQQLSFEAVLRHYKVEIKAKGKQHHSFCPLPKHGGNRNSPSFSAHLEKGIFQCFGCNAKGNLLDFAVLMDGGNPDNPADLRKTALGLQTTFAVALKAKEGQTKKPEVKPPPQSTGTILVNAKLDFELKTLDYNHPYLRSRKFTDETIEKFGLGFCSKGYLEGRIAIPLHDQLGRLIGYAGRIVDDRLIDEDNPRYRFPCERERKGITYKFEKSQFLYRGFEIKEPVDDLIVVEGFPSLWWLYQHRIENVAALMGWHCSEAQAKLMVTLTKPNGRVWLMPDGDKTGRQCAESVLAQVAPHRFIRWIQLDEGKQPTNYEGRDLKTLLNQ